MKLAQRHVELATNRVRRWWPWLLASLFLHLPLTPIGPLIGLVGLLVHLRTAHPEEPVEELLGISLEVESGPPVPAAALPAAPAQPEAFVIATPKPRPPKPAEPERPDAGVDAGTDGSGGSDAGLADAGDGGVADAGLADAGDGGVADAGLADAGDGHLGDAGTDKPDPFAIAGDFPKEPQANDNVKIHLFTSAIRNHPAAGAISALLAAEPQWQDFIGPGGIDPIRDLTRIALYGPQLVNSSKVAVFLEYSAEPTKIVKAVERLVERSEGGRLTTENRKRVAYVKAAGAERAIIFLPNKILAIVPLGPVHAQLVKVNSLKLPSSSDDAEVFQGSLQKNLSRKAKRWLNIDVPESLSEGRLFISTTPNGGASLRVELVDASAQEAMAHVGELERQASALTLGLVTISFRTEQNRIVAESRLSPLQLAGIFSRISQEIERSRGRSTRP